MNDESECGSMGGCHHGCIHYAQPRLLCVHFPALPALLIPSSAFNQSGYVEAAEKHLDTVQTTLGYHDTANHRLASMDEMQQMGMGALAGEAMQASWPVVHKVQEAVESWTKPVVQGIKDHGR